MVRSRNIALPATWDEALLRKKAARALGVPVGKLHRCVPVRQSIDARKKGDVHYVMTVDVSLPHEEAVVARGKGNQISLVEPPVPYAFPQVTRVSTLPPVVVGSGPAGLSRWSPFRKTAPSRDICLTPCWSFSCTTMSSSAPPTSR